MALEQKVDFPNIEGVNVDAEYLEALLRVHESWTANDLTANELPKGQSNSVGRVETVEFDDDNSAGPLTGQPRHLTNGFVLTNLQYDPETNKLTRRSLTATRKPSEDVPSDVYKDALEAANEVDQIVWDRLVIRSEDTDGEGWLESCLATNSTLPLSKEQSKVAIELQTDYPEVEMINLEWEVFEGLF
ncbi:hypothetical protein I350_04440 [Cryptococcus amylolentus CBS 6273]|uniref:Uncharacterized protein n=1 Tax=Cryptococcus amylolentus CBS 6273 TaxID=1296118 RepID=A0A1E3K4B5_9TREE|nr:hypothetical protein I350_04440 [Cryptococcus amylolentus CBS 6273]